MIRDIASQNRCSSGDFGNFLYLLWLVGVWLGIVFATSLKITTAANNTRNTKAA
jgi:hypothetical protein